MGLFYYNLPEVDLSDWNIGDPFDGLCKLFLEEETSTSFEYDVDTEEYVELDLTYIKPQFEWIHDMAKPTDDGTVVITDSDGITITNIDETGLVPEPYGRMEYFLFTIHHNEHFYSMNSRLPIEICRGKTADKINATGIVTIQTKTTSDTIKMFIITSSKLTVTDSKGNVIAMREGTGEAIKLDLLIQELPSSEYTVRLENMDALGNLVEHKESKFILDNPRVKADSENDSKLSSVAVPIGIGIAVLLVIGAGIATGVTLNKKKKDKLSEEKKED